MFFSKILSSIEAKYWPIKLKIACLVQILKKIRHIIESTELLTIIYIDYSITIDITRQAILLIILTNRLNLRLIRVSDYIQRFNLTLKYIPNKTNIILDILSRLEIINELLINLENLKLDALFIVIIIMIKMSNEFRQKLINKYKRKKKWVKIRKTIKKNDKLKRNIAKISFRLNFNGVIQHINKYIGLKKPYVLRIYLKEVLDSTYYGHKGFRIYSKDLTNNQYISRLTAKLRIYLKHYFKYKIY